MTVTGSSQFRVSRRALVFLTCLALAVGGAGASLADESGDPSIRSDQVAADVSTRLLAERDVDMTLEGFSASGAPVTVEIVHTSGMDGSVAAEVNRLGGQVLLQSAGLILAEVPSVGVRLLEDHFGVDHVRQPVRVDLISEMLGLSESSLGAGDVHVTATNASAWHNAGYLGQGVKIGIIDVFDNSAWVTAQASGAVPSPAGTFCQWYGTSCNIWRSFERHGVAVAEIVHDMAPAAKLYLATAATASDLAAAVAWFDRQGVQIITRSMGSQLDGPGDGTGSIDAVVDDAVNRGMAWFNAAGNHASRNGVSGGGYWRGKWIDANANGWLDFAPGDEALGFSCGWIQGFRWSDWQASGRSDYDIFITDYTTGATVATSASNQTLGAPALELIDSGVIDCDVHPVLNLWVHRFSAGSGTDGDVLEFMVNRSSFEYSSNPYSASQPAADSANPGMMAVGAIDPARGTVIASYSSQGPSNDGRQKPDLSAPSCLVTTSYGSIRCFNGTSAATPVTAGAAALVWGAGVATTPTGVTQYLRTHAIDRGPSGPDTIYGSGQLYLGTPPGTAQPPSPPFTGHVTGLVDPSQGLWHLFDTTGAEVTSFYYGNPGDYPFMGDWNCDGTETPGLYRQSDGYAYLRNSNTQGNAEIKFFFGNPGDVPIAGDFNGDGCDTVSIYRPSNQTFYIINKLGQNGRGLGAADFSYVFGNPGDKPFVGDFDGDGVETVGLHRESSGLVYFRNSHKTGVADKQFLFGDPGDRLIAGDWTGDGIFSPALFRSSNTTMYFRHTNTQGSADRQFRPSPNGATWLPVSGKR